MRDGWTETTLGDIASWSSGKNLSSDKRDETGLVPILGANGIIGRTNEVLLDVELITVGRVGACGETHRSTGPVWVSDNALIVIPKEQVIFDLLFYVLSTFNYQSIISGTTQPLITQSKMKSQVVNLPPLTEQKRIVDVVSSVDSYIYALQQQADTARTARNAVLHELLTAGGDDWTETALSALLSRSIGGVWGTEPETDQEEVTVVRSTEFTKNGFLNFATGVPRSIKSSQLSSRELAEGDILLEKSGGGPEQPVGRVVYVQSDIPPRFVCSNFIQLLTPVHQKVLPRFLFLVMWMWHFENKTLEYQAQTTGIRNLRTPDYLEQFIALPPLGEQKRIVEIVSSMDEMIQSTEQAVVDAKNLRSGLLSDLLSGEHEIHASYDSLVGAA